MRVAQVVPSIAGEASGLTSVLLGLCRALAEAGAKVELHVLAPVGSSPDRSFGTHAHARVRCVKRLGVSPSMRRALSDAASRSDILHSHSLWMMPNVYPARAVRGTRCRLVVAPHGTLSPGALRFSYWKKRLMWIACQREAVKAAACLHATSEDEYEDIRRLGLRAPVAVIPNGVDFPRELPPRRAGGARRRLLFLGRLHRIKGVEALLRAWGALEDAFDDWELHVVGPDARGRPGEFQALACELGLGRVTFRGPLYGDDKASAYREADLYVLPTHSENFGMTVAEALAHGTPAIVTKGAPWEGLERHGCGWWIDIGEGPLTECLRTALALPRETLYEMGSRGREWMARDFSWARIARMMKDTYVWLLGGGTAPEWVYLT